MEGSREPVVIEGLRPPLHHLSPDFRGAADIDRVGVETLGAMLKTIDPAVLDPHEILIAADKKADIAIPKARGKDKFRIAVQAIANGVNRQDQARRDFSIHAISSVAVDWARRRARDWRVGRRFRLAYTPDGPGLHRPQIEAGGQRAARRPAGASRPSAAG